METGETATPVAQKVRVSHMFVQCALTPSRLKRLYTPIEINGLMHTLLTPQGVCTALRSALEGLRRSGARDLQHALGRRRNEVLILSVKVVPRASKPGIAVEPDGSLKVRLQSPPVEGAANAELVRLLADAFGVAKRAVMIVGGMHSRTKRVQIDGAEELPRSIVSADERPMLLRRRTPRR